MKLLSYLKPKPSQRPPSSVQPHGPLPDAAQRIAATWGADVLDHQAWLAKSPACLTLRDWLKQAWRYIHFLGPRGYRDAVAQMLSRASKADLVALGFDFETREALDAVKGTDAGTVFCIHCQDETHIAVHWSANDRVEDELWIDGRFVQAAPGQPRYAAVKQTLAVHQPTASEEWTEPYLVCADDGTLMIYPNSEAPTPDRRMPLGQS